MLQMSMYPRPPALLQSNPLAGAEAWDARSIWNLPGLDQANLNSLLAPAAAVAPLEGAGRMAQDGGVISRGSLGIPGMAGYQDLGGHYITNRRGTLGRRTLMEVNHNKAITKKLVSAVHYQQVLDCVAQNIQMFDEVNVATALHRLAKLQPPGPSSQPSPIVYADQFQHLVAAIGRLLPRFEAQAVSNTMWAFATLSYFPENNLLDQLAMHAVSIISTFRPQATSNTLWAFAKLGYCPCKALLEAGSHQMLQDLSKSVPQDISNTLWAFATLRHHPGADLMNRAAHQAVITIQRFKPQELANTLWSFAMLEHDPSYQLLDAMAIQIIAKIQGFRPQAVSNGLWAYAKLGYNPGILMLDVAAQKAVGMLHQYTSQELANTVWALAVLEHYPGPGTMNSAASQIARRIEQFTLQDAANSVWAFAQLNHGPSRELCQAIAVFTVRHWQQLKAAELVKILTALASLGGCPVATWQVLLVKLGDLPAASFSEVDLQQLYLVYLLLKAKDAGMSAALQGSFPEGLLAESERAWRAQVGQQDRMSAMHHAVSECLNEFGISHRNNFITADGLHTAHTILDGTNVVLEIQEAGQFASNCHLLLGRGAARTTLLKGSGYLVLEVTHLDWVKCKSPTQQQSLLSALLDAVHLYNTPGLALSPAMRATAASSQALVANPFSQAPSTSSPIFASLSSTAELPISTSAFDFESLSQALSQ